MPQFMGGRFLLGFGVSYCCIAAPTYVSELAHPKVCNTMHVVQRIYSSLLTPGSGEVRLQDSTTACGKWLPPTHW